jgi:hypothetical protein
VGQDLDVGMEQAITVIKDMINGMCGRMMVSLVLVFMKVHAKYINHPMAICAKEVQSPLSFWKNEK